MTIETDHLKGVQIQYQGKKTTITALAIKHKLPRCVIVKRYIKGLRDSQLITKEEREVFELDLLAKKTVASWK